MNLTDKLQLAYSKLTSAQRILIVGHTRPDADALASVGALMEIAVSSGIEIYAYADKKPVDSYNFIPGEELIFETPPDDLKVFDVIFILDCGSISRTSLEVRLRTLIKATAEGRLVKRPYIIEFDHHQPLETYADLEIRLPDKASTTEIIYHFLKANSLEITKTLANSILIGLMTDTGHFFHANSSREAMAIASEMLLRGASLPKIINYTVNNKSYTALKIWGRALDNLHFNPATGLVSSALAATELENIISLDQTAIGPDLYSDIVSFLSTLSGVSVALFLREEGGVVKGSLRTNSDEIDVAKIAANWGGGGHKKASGFTIEGRLAKTEKGWKVIKGVK